METLLLELGDASRLPIYTARPQACVKAKIRLTHGLSSSVSLKRRGTACWGGVAKREPWHCAKRVELSLGASGTCRCEDQPC